MNAEDIYRIRFSKPPVGRRGYQTDEVDAFLDVIAARLKLRNHLTAEVVHRIAFGRAPVDEGYDTDEVDHFLNQVEAVLAGNRQKTSQHARTCVPVTSSDQRSPDRQRGNRNRAAVVSLCASILGFSLVGIVVAILSGVIAFIKIRRTHQRGRAFVIAGLVISAAWVALIFVWLHMGHPNPFHPSTANRRSMSVTAEIQGQICSVASEFGQKRITIFGSNRQFGLGI
jgi:DivIVA domain-containing protein